MILIVDLNWKKDSLGFCEFLLPIAAVVEKLDNYIVKHYLDLTDKDLSGCVKIILSGTALKDIATLSQPEKFRWLKETQKPILGICAGMETIGMVFGAHLVKCLEIGMTPITTLKENILVSGDFKAYSLHSYFTATVLSPWKILRFGHNLLNVSKLSSIERSQFSVFFFILKLEIKN
jgi:anthranilate/para-aminobenzoate synthase component II